ncbi:mitochondrial peptide methionine sulfoxide reductase-like [Convolutriloba macropyga]|uniref:mitochondrial peptide methionine sulfoxide reductase-like n=1 Tax=Convolutriloba macropyga TaxID=536237 RepID=UPI003F51D954
MRFLRLKMGRSMTMPCADNAIKGTESTIKVNSKHAVNGNPTVGPFDPRYHLMIFGLGCFWGAERKFWKKKGVFSTQVGYSGGFTKNPTYEQVCSGGTGHAEVVRVVYDPEVVGLNELLQIFWEAHDPTQGMRQGNDFGTQYRSALYYTREDQKVLAEKSLSVYQELILKRITTEIKEAGPFYYAEDYHQQYLHKVPGGYCGLKGTGVSCPKVEL